MRSTFRFPDVLAAMFCCSPRFRAALACFWIWAVLAVPANAQRIQSVSIPVGSMDADSYPLNDDVWSVSAPPYPLDVHTGIGGLVRPIFFASGETFVLHDHQYVLPHAPDPTRAVITYRFDQPAVVKTIEVVQHTNGITQVEGFVGDTLESLTSIGAVFGPLGDVTGEGLFVEGERYAFEFGNTVAGRVFQLVIRKTSSSDGWASYRAYPIDVTGLRIQPAVLSGGIYAWGWNRGGGYNDCAANGIPNSLCGQTGVPDAPVVPTPSALVAVPDAVAVGGGMFHSLAVRADGTVWAWGMNGSGQLGSGGGPGAFSVTPIQVPVSDAIAVAGGWHQSHAIRSDGTLWSWGSAFTGLGSYSSFELPMQVPGLTNVVAVAAGEASSYAVLSDGTLWSWGFNGHGLLGRGSTNPSALSPAQVTALHDVVAVATHFVHALALTRDGIVWTWGNNDFGQLGDGTQVERHTPTQVRDLTDIAQVAAGAFNSYALRNDGTVWTWGYHGGYTYSSPVPIGGLEGVTAIAAGGMHLLVRKADRSLWAWGDNSFGQLGTSTHGGFEWVPVPVAGVGPADLIAAGRVHSLATIPVDTAAPVITVPDTIFEDATSPVGAVVEYTVTVVDDLDPAPVLSCTPASGSVFPQLGPTTVTCTATDAAGHTASAAFDVVIKDAAWQLEDAIGLIQSWELRSPGTSLVDKLRTARSFVLQGKGKQACDTLRALLNQVHAQSGSRLTFEQAADLTVRATRIRSVIGC